MTERLNCNVADTAKLLGAILSSLRGSENARVMFLCDAGKGKDIIQRVRVKLSRVRKNAIANGKRLRHFNLHNSIHSHTEDGLRYDCVVVWKSQSARHSAMESLEDLIGHGDRIQ